MDAMHTSSEPSSAQGMVTKGIVGGVAAGVVFIVAEMVINGITGKPFLGPLRLISSIVLGIGATQPSYPLASSLIVAIITHLILSSIYGVVFMYLLAFTGQLGASLARLLTYGLLLGLALWVFNLLILGSTVFPQFGMINQLWNGFVAHTFLYGAPLGIFISLLEPPVSDT